MSSIIVSFAMLFAAVIALICAVYVALEANRKKKANAAKQAEYVQ